ncbi:putative ubiqitin hydrolase [Trypanosoma conorhini]|uniref:Putative ubiqitin hydrolase n=1 Tax=Trypanosoma conorhini TaxID=83891 RepID=A0A422NW88_9TRYP|nr:putative ubiqitin hydrolase [Trypanosoma conorhini]RNF09708.1 putative ubiqitin hydrolase [Trypanosoma conorhini]
MLDVVVLRPDGGFCRDRQRVSLTPCLSLSVPPSPPSPWPLSRVGELCAAARRYQMSASASPTKEGEGGRGKRREGAKEKEEGEGVEMRSLAARGAPAPPRRAVAPCIVCPLLNLGNTCYFNTGVQLLANCNSFVYGLRNSPFRHPSLGPRALKLCCSGGRASQTLFQAFAQLLYDMEFVQLRGHEALSPLKALDCLAAVHSAFEGYGEQDCSEMVSVVVANLSEEGRQRVELEALLRSFEEDTAALAAPDAVDRDCASHSPPIVGVDARSVTQEDAVGVLVGGEARSMFSSTDVVKGDNLPLPPPFPCSAQSPSPFFPFPGDWWTYNTLRLMQAVNHDNEQLERKAKARRNEPYRNTFRPPMLHYNGVTDCFTGYLLSEVRCHNCGSTSRIVEEFSSLAIDVASYSQRKQYAQRYPEVQRAAGGRASAQPKSRWRFQWWNPITWFLLLKHSALSLLRWFTRRIEYPLTLKECLDIHFDPVLLKGNNKYLCDSCNTLSEATKRDSLLTLPEYLVLQMKRFEHGICFNKKKTDTVEFPVSWEIGAAANADVLELSDYMHDSVSCSATSSARFQSFLGTDTGTSATEAATTTTTTTNPGQTQRTMSSNTEGVEGDAPGMQSPVHTYTLEGVVDHRGSIMGGHYIAYAHKTKERPVWLRINDDEMDIVDVGEVADANEYLLLYKKQPLTPRPQAVLSLRQKAQSLLAIPPAEGELPPCGEATARAKDTGRTDADEVVYISRPWLQRMAFMEEPGPILNRLCYGTGDREDHAAALQQQEPASEGRRGRSAGSFPVGWFYVPLRREEYDAFYKMYGGNRAVGREEYEALYEAQRKVV